MPLVTGARFFHVGKQILRHHLNLKTLRQARALNMKFQYPAARRDDSAVEDLHGTKVADPYRWMEDPDAEETKKFVDAQNAITQPFLNSCAIKEKLHSKIKTTWDYPKYSCPKKKGPRYFYYHNSGLQNQSVQYVQESLDGEAKVFIDPNQLSEDGTVAIRGESFTEDGNVYAYGLSSAGSDWVTIKFKDVAAGKDLPDVLERVKFSSMAWTHDNKGIFYNSYPQSEEKQDGTETTANLNQKLFYHVMGTEQSQDVLCAEWLENPKWMTGAEVSDCGHYVIITISEGCDPVNKLYYCDLQQLKDGIKGLLPVVKVVDNFDAEYEYITNEGSIFTFKTNLKSPRYKLINIDFNNHGMENWKDLVPEHEKDVLEWVACVNTNKLILNYLHDVKSELFVYDLSTGNRTAKLPLDIGSVVGYSGKKKDTEIFYQFMSFLTPGVIYRCDVSTDKYEPKVFRQIQVKDFDASMFEQKQVFFPSKDGTKIPMFIIHKKDLKLDGNNPTLLYGYGGFNISITPWFSVSRVVFINNLNGVYAVANIRGGGEYGETWHKAGCYGQKQNVFDDFHAAAEFLIDNKYTSPKRLTINGGSNGGLLVAACANQRPDLYGCVINQVGVMDMLRFHKFTIGHAWTTDFGCADKKDNFEYLYKYSPLHNIRQPEGDKQYPAMLLMTADHDDRVVPLHSLKYIAELQNVMGGVAKQTNPLLIRVDTKAGHGAGKPTSKSIEEVTEMYCFVVVNQNIEWAD